MTFRRTRGGRAVRVLMLGGVLLGATASFARPVGAFEDEPTDARSQLPAASRVRGLHAYTADEEAPPPPFPWKAVGLLVLVLGVTTPFAIRAYKQMANELGTDSRRAE